ncbi:MAG: murein biosynthesis integral membrane protein MurJ [Clostridia bacterium]|nr:murein biosynthesis integral membrane protein MurJ [Clostridia bacterium]
MNEKKKPSLAQSAALMGIIILFSKALGLLRDILVASAYGTTQAGVAYETASRLPVTVFDFVLGGVVTAAFIPVYNSLAVKKGKKEALRFCQSYINLILLLTAVLALAGTVFAPALVRLIAPELVPETRDLAVRLTRVMFPMVIFVGLAFSFVGFLQSEGEYNIPALISLVSNLLMVGYLLFLNGRFGVGGLAAAMLVGWCAQTAVQIPAVVKRGFRPKLTAPLGTPEIARAAKNTLPILVATWTTPICSVINTRLASGIEGGRAIGALGYANRLYIIIVGLFSFVATNLLFPVFARAAAEGDSAEGDRLTRASLKTLVFIIAPISAGVAVLAVPFVGLIYENGVFTPDDTLLTASALSMYAAGMLFSACAEVLTKAFFAAEKTRLPMISSLISIGFNVAVLYAARAVLGERFGVGAIALVTALSAGVNAGVLYLFAAKKGILTPKAADWADAAKSLLSALVMAFAVRLLWVKTGDLGLGRLTGFALSVLCGALVYAVCVNVLRAETVKVLAGKLKKKEGAAS